MDVREFIRLGGLDDIVKHEHSAVVAGFEDEYILIFGFLVVKDLVDFEGHGLPWPLLRDLAEPAIYNVMVSRCQRKGVV